MFLSTVFGNNKILILLSNWVILDSQTKALPMSLFQPSVLKKYLSQQDSAVGQKSYEKYAKYFHNAAIQENIRNSIEEQFQEGFLRELFVDILGYTLNLAANFNLTTVLKNIKGAKKAMALPSQMEMHQL